MGDPIELQQSQGLLSMTPHRRQEQCCAMRGLHTIVSYHCRHCTDLWDWIGSQGLLFRDPTSSHAALAGQLDPCEVMIVSLQLKMSTATLNVNSKSDKQFLNFGNSRLNEAWLLTLYTSIECNAMHSKVCISGELKNLSDGEICCSLLETRKHDADLRSLQNVQKQIQIHSKHIKLIRL